MQHTLGYQARSFGTLVAGAVDRGLGSKTVACVLSDRGPAGCLTRS